MDTLPSAPSSALRTVYAASSTFEAARQLHTAPEPHPARRLHGHSFLAQLESALPAGWAAFPGGELLRLRERLAGAVAPLDHALLNDHIDAPDDAAIARWLAGRLDLPGQRLRLRSHRDQGVALEPEGGITLWRRYRFVSAHWLPHVPAGHKCGRLHGHGFAAVLHLVLAPGETTLAAAARLDAAWAPLQAQLDHACLNELPGLDNPTSELLASWVWQRLQPGLPTLAGVSVRETASSGAHFDGTHHRIWKDFSLDSALQYRRAPAGHPLGRLHGSTCTLRLCLGAPLHEVLGWAVDFGDVKRLFAPVFQRLDHQPLHQLPGLPDCDTASLAAWILRSSREQLPALQRVGLYEAPGCGAIVDAQGS